MSKAFSDGAGFYTGNGKTLLPHKEKSFQPPMQ